MIFLTLTPPITLTDAKIKDILKDEFDEGIMRTNYWVNEISGYQ